MRKDASFSEFGEIDNNETRRSKHALEVTMTTARTKVSGQVCT